MTAPTTLTRRPTWESFLTTIVGKEFTDDGRTWEIVELTGEYAKVENWTWIDADNYRLQKATLRFGSASDIAAWLDLYGLI